MKKIFLVLFILAAFDALGNDRHKDLFRNPIVQDSLKTFIEKNSHPFKQSLWGTDNLFGYRRAADTQ